MSPNYLILRTIWPGRLTNPRMVGEALLPSATSSYDAGVRNGHHTPPGPLARDAKPPLGAASARLRGL